MTTKQSNAATSKIIRGNLIAAVVFGAVIVGVFAGRNVAHHWIDWQVLALTLAGFGTLALALATRRETEVSLLLVAAAQEQTRASSDLATAGQRQSEVSWQAFLASVKPILVETVAPERMPATVGTDSVTVQLRNLGVGPAFMRGVRFCWFEQGRPIDQPAKYEGTYTLFTVAPGDNTSLSFNFEGQETRLAYVRSELKRFWIEADYRDSTGAQLDTVRLDFALDARADKLILADIRHSPTGSGAGHDQARASIA